MGIFTGLGCPLTKEQLKKIRRGRIKRYAGFVFSGLKHFNLKQAKTYLECLLYTSRIKL